jgi:regulator of replication initiation timing
MNSGTGANIFVNGKKIIDDERGNIQQVRTEMRRYLEQEIQALGKKSKLKGLLKEWDQSQGLDSFLESIRKQREELGWRDGKEKDLISRLLNLPGIRDFTNSRDKITTIKTRMEKAEPRASEIAQKLSSIIDESWGLQLEIRKLEGRTRDNSLPLSLISRFEKDFKEKGEFSDYLDQVVSLAGGHKLTWNSPEERRKDEEIRDKM